MRDKVIFLVDMQSFYASVEKAAHPHLKNSPVIVSGDPERRSGVVLAACPLAKKYGVNNAERLWEAQQKCPQAVVIRPRMQVYINVSLQITSILKRFTDLVEPYSIDEQFMDITGSQHLFGTPLEIARMIQATIMNETHIRARVGIGHTKVLAKMACDHFAKRNQSGIFSLPLDEMEQILWPLPVHKMFMVGSRMSRHLQRMGIRTIGQLAQYPLAGLRAKWGVNGEVLWQIANGQDSSPVTPAAYDSPKAIGHQMTLPFDYHTLDQILVPLLELSELVCQRARAKGYMGWVVSVSCQGADFEQPAGFLRQMKLPEPTNLTREVYQAASVLFKRHWNGWPIRRVGVTLGQLESDKEYQLSFFSNREEELALERTIDSMKEKYGNGIIMRACSLTSAGQAKDRAQKIGGHYK